MIHAIVYANRGTYSFYERTPGFPKEYEPDIQTICAQMDPGTGSYPPTLCYRPLGEKYLLTVLYRISRGNDAEHRAHVICVNFLMDSQEADRFFQASFSAAARHAVETATLLMEQFRNMYISNSACLNLLDLPEGGRMPQPAAIPLHILVSGAAYSMEKRMSSQLYLQTDTDAAENLEYLMDCLPPALRKGLSFHTCCICPEESRGYAMCFCPAPVLDQMAAQGFAGAAPSQKFFYYSPRYGIRSQVDDRYVELAKRMEQMKRSIPLYPVLQFALDSWENFLELSLLMKSQLSMRSVLPLLSERTVVQIVLSAPLSDEDLRMLYKNAPRHSAIRGAVKSRMPSAGLANSLLHIDLSKWKSLCYGLISCLLFLISFSCGLKSVQGTGLFCTVVCCASAFAAGFFLHDVWNMLKNKKTQGETGSE